MSVKDLIVHLIREDMRFTQYIAALRKLGIEVYGFAPDLMSIAGKLLNVKEEMYDAWMEVYITQLCKCEELVIEPLGNNLIPMAEECYSALLNFQKNNDLSFTKVSENKG